MRATFFYIKQKYFPIFLMIVGLLGSVFFFPVQMGGRHTCVYHRIFAAEKNSPFSGHPMDNSMSSQSGYGDQMENAHNQGLLNRYLVPFGLLWWLSLAFLASGVFLLKRHHQSLDSGKYLKMNKQN